MPNPVAVNDLSPISGSLQTSRVSYGVETAGKNYGQNYNSTNWYSDIPNNGQFYTIISDNYTANYYVSRSNAGGAYVEGGLPAVDEYSAPVFWITQGTSSLDVITIVNGLPDRIGQVPFNSGSQALNWVASSSNYFAVGPDYYAQIDADNLRLYLDANQVISYPTTQSTWYDLSGYNQNFTLYNGLQTSWNTNGWFAFDQTDDYALNTTSQFQSSSGTIIVTCYPNSGLNDDYIAGVGGDLTIGGSRAIGIISGQWWFVGYGSSTQDYISGFAVNSNRWSQVVYTWNNITEITASVNGVFETVTRSGLVTPSGVNFTLGRPPWNNAAATWGGNLSTVQFYPKALTQAEVLQNYYGGPIVTGSISGSYQAGNLVSYVTGSTATYNMAANIVSGSLQNGVSYSPTNGGYWSFDGSDDRILLEGSTTNAWTLPTSIDWTVTAWIRTTTTANGLGQGSIFSNSNGGPVYSMLGINAGVITYWYYFSSWVKSNGTIPVNDGNWHMLTWVNFAGGTMNLYVDGGIDTAGVNSNTSSGNALDIIGASWTGYFQGDIASLQINKGKAFTADEVLQQYNATK
jgi:hypothetical protein